MKWANSAGIVNGRTEATLVLEGNAEVKQDFEKLIRGRLKYLYNMQLTNLEVEAMFHDMMSDWFDENANGNYNAFIKAMLINDINAMNKYLNRVALTSFSFFDVGRKSSEYTEPERFYHGFVLRLKERLF